MKKIMRTTTEKPADRRGFTLVEIMIVVVIIGLLAAMAVPAFQKVRASSQATTLAENLQTFRETVYQFDMEAGYLPADMTDGFPTGMADEMPKAWVGKPPIVGTYGYTNTGNDNATITFTATELDPAVAEKVDDILDAGNGATDGVVTYDGTTITVLIYEPSNS